MPSCVVPFCTTRDRKSHATPVSYHEFPCDLNLCAKWLRAIARKDWLPSATGHSHVCSRHFLPEDFMTGVKVKRLRPGTVPSLFEGYPKYMQMRRQKQRSTSAIEKRKECKKLPPVLVRPVVQMTNDGQVTQLAGLQIHMPPPKQTDTKLPPRMLNVATQVDVTRVKQMMELQKWRTRARRLKLKVKKLKEELKAEKENKTVIKGLDLYETVIEAARDKDPYAVFILDQIRNFGVKNPRWSESTVSECSYLRNISFQAYSRARRLVRLPAIHTVKRCKNRHIEEVLSAVASGTWETQDSGNVENDSSAAVGTAENGNVWTGDTEETDVNENKTQAIFSLQDHCYLASQPAQAWEEYSNDICGSQVTGTEPQVYIRYDDSTGECVALEPIENTGLDQRFCRTDSYSVISAGANSENQIFNGFQDDNVCVLFDPQGVAQYDGKISGSVVEMYVELASTEVC